MITKIGDLVVVDATEDPATIHWDNVEFEDGLQLSADIVDPYLRLYVEALNGTGILVSLQFGPDGLRPDPCIVNLKEQLLWVDVPQEVVFRGQSLWFFEEGLAALLAEESELTIWLLGRETPLDSSDDPEVEFGLTLWGTEYIGRTNLSELAPFVIIE